MIGDEALLEKITKQVGSGTILKATGVTEVDLDPGITDVIEVVAHGDHHDGHHNAIVIAVKSHGVMTIEGRTINHLIGDIQSI